MLTINSHQECKYLNGISRITLGHGDEFNSPLKLTYLKGIHPRRFLQSTLGHALASISDFLFDSSLGIRSKGSLWTLMNSLFNSGC